MGLLRKLIAPPASGPVASGAPLSFPVSVSRIECPYCQNETHRI